LLKYNKVYYFEKINGDSMRVAIVGSRNIENEENVYELLCRYVPANTTEIVSGGATGIDTLAEVYAERNRLRLTVFKPDYKSFGKRAPLVRNEEIIRYAQYVLAFWDGVSHGTAHTVATCVAFGVPVKVIPLENFNRHEEF
jgi:hypothetical protein